MIMERVKIEKRQLVKIIILFAISVAIFEISTAPRIICKVDCSTCPGGVMDQDFTKEAKSIKGKGVEVLAQDGKMLNFKNCYALKKEFFSRHFVRVYDLEWNRWF
jgi:hypothetical protein